MTTRDVTDSEGHGENGEPKSEGDAGISDTDIGDAGCEHGCAASTKHQPEGSKEFRCCAFTDWHNTLLALQIWDAFYGA